MEVAALIGLPNSGVSTLFDALIGGHAPHAAGKGQLRRGDIKVPDPRVDHLGSVFKPKKLTHADLVCTDVGGFEPDGKNLNKQLMNHLQSADALVPVLRAFADFGEPKPVEDLDHVLENMRLSDFVIVEQRAERMRKQAAKGAEADLLPRLQECLEADRPLRAMGLGEHELALVSGYGFLSLKPVIAIVNAGEDGADEATVAAVRQMVEPYGGQCLVANAAMEKEVAELPEDEQAEFLRELGIERPARGELLRAVYQAMELIPFFTVGEDEVRAWTIRRGTPAVRAAGKIHSDLERGFIRAEVIHYDQFVACGNSMTAAKERGALRLEGKEYEVKDGDIITVRFSV